MKLGSLLTGSGSGRRAAPARSPSSRARVLCIDDAPDITEMLARLIRREPDLDDAGALDSVDGLVAEVERRGATIVVIDLSIPGGEPLKAIRELTARAPSCRIIAYSGYDDPETREAARRAGAWELVSKAIDPREVVRVIRRAASAPASVNAGAPPAA